MLRPYKDLVQPISLKRSTLNLLISTSSSADYPIFGVRLASTANCSSLASMSGRPRSRSTWPRSGAHPRRAGGPSLSIMPTALLRRCGPRAFAIGRSRHGHPGKMHMLRGSSVLSDGIASTMSLSSASRIFAICCARIKGTTMRRGLTSPYAKTRHNHAPSRRAAVSSSHPF